MQRKQQRIRCKRAGRITWNWDYTGAYMVGLSWASKKLGAPQQRLSHFGSILASLVLETPTL